MAQSLACSASSGPLVLAVPAALQSARLATKKYLPTALIKEQLMVVSGRPSKFKGKEGMPSRKWEALR